MFAGILFSIVFLIAFSYYVFASFSTVDPLVGTNYTRTITFNVTYTNSSEIASPTNMSCFANKTGVWTYIGGQTTLTTSNGGPDQNATWGDINITLFTDGVYTVNCTLVNATAGFNNIFTNGSTTVVQNIRFDSNPPLANFYTGENILTGGNMTLNGNDDFIISAIVTDGFMGVNSVFINITKALNITGQVNFTNASRQGTTNYYNFTINRTSFGQAYYNITIYANDTELNNENKTTVALNVYFDRTYPNASTPIFPTTGANLSDTITFNASATDNSVLKISGLFFNLTNGSASTTQINITIGEQSAGTLYWNGTLNVSQLGDGLYNLTVYANDTANNLNKTTVVQNIRIDNTAPGLAFSCTPNPVDEGDTITCSCSATDTGSGINTSYGTSGLSYTSKPSTSSTGTHTVTCSSMDRAGNSVSATTKYTVGTGTSSGGGGGGGGTTTVPSQSQSWASIAAGESKEMTSIPVAYGVEKITVQAAEAATGAKLTVMKYDSKPSTVETKSGKVYRYLQIKSENLQLEKATVSVIVQNSWMNENNLGKNDVSIFKFDDSAKKWNELSTTYVKSDTTYSYYNAVVTSFSYFAIADKASAAAETTTPAAEETTPSEGAAAEETTVSAWSWILTVIVIIVVVIIGYFGYKAYKNSK